MIREFRPEDRAAIDDICIRTALAGEDATGLLPDDHLWCDLYARPYLELEPDLAFVVELPAGEGAPAPSGGSAPAGPTPAGLARAGTPAGTARVVGYVLGTADSRTFARRFREEWLPRVAGAYPLGPRDDQREADLVRDLHRPERDLRPELAPYPAHLHIDLLPEAQGRGWGRALVATFLRALRERGVPAVHLSHAPENLRAAAFYAHLGFRPVPGLPSHLWLASDALGAPSGPASGTPSHAPGTPDAAGTPDTAGTPGTSPDASAER